jgi:hypothetical protein
MFKLIKILGARYNAPEIVEIEAELSGICVAGYFYFLDNYSILPHTGEETTNVFVPIETKEGEGSTVRIKGYYVTGDMVFEGKLYGSIDALYVGSLVAAHVNDGLVLDGISAGSGEFARIMSIEDYEATGNVTFRLII